jgi:hypothetical protein
MATMPATQEGKDPPDTPSNDPSWFPTLSELSIIEAMLPLASYTEAPPPMIYEIV